MRGELHSITTIDGEFLDHWVPDHPTDFGLMVRLWVGIEGGRGEDAIDIVVCGPKWSGVSHLKADPFVIERYDYDELCMKLREAVSAITADDWRDVAQQIGELGPWE